MLIFKNNEFSYDKITDQNSAIIMDNHILKIAQQGATVGNQLTWDGNQWVPSKNETVSYSANNGVKLNGTTFSLADNLSWQNNTFTVGANSSASFAVNRLSSNIYSPLRLKNSSDETMLDINAQGQLSIGFNGAHNGYNIASDGFNLFTHIMGRYQAAIGTTNIGTAEFGPTLLIHSVPFDNPSPSRSVIEILNMNGESVFEVQENGHTGISTISPKATLDINGYARLKKYNSAPDTCSVDKDGLIALTSTYKLCACNGTTGAWVETADGSSSCSW